MTDPPVISIITVTFNDRNNLEKTLKSVASQTYREIEHILVDGGSTDGTMALIQDYSLPSKRWTSGQDSGIYDAMNKGLAMVEGDYVTFLNAGDFYCDEFVLARLFEGVGQAQPDIVYGNHFVYDPKNPGHRHYLKAYTFSRHNLLKWGTRVVCHQAFFIRKDLAPSYDTSLRFKAELNWYFDIEQQNPDLSVAYKDFPVVMYATGGMAYRHFWKNQLEYYKLIRNRFGFKTVWKYNHLKKIMYGLTFKYGGIRKLIPKKVFDMLRPKVD